MKTWHFVISEKCNMNCTYCNVNKTSNESVDFLNFLSFYDKNIFGKDEQYKFDIFGGETLLWIDDVYQICSFLMNDNNCVRIEIPTNGTIYNNKVEDLLQLDKVTVSISHDGINQKENRGNNKVYLNEFLNTKKVKSVHTMIQGMDLKNNPDILVEQMLFFNSYNIIPDIALVRDINSWDTSSVELFKNGFNDYCKYFEDFILPVINKYTEIPGLILQYLNTFLNKVIDKHDPHGCKLGTDYFAVINNQVISCERFTRTNDEYKLKDIDKYLKECNNCSIRDYCVKGCTYEIIQNDGVIVELCDIYKHIIKNIKELVLNNKKLVELYLKGRYNDK